MTKQGGNHCKESRKSQKKTKKENGDSERVGLLCKGFSAGVAVAVLSKMDGIFTLSSTEASGKDALLPSLVWQEV